MRMTRMFLNRVENPDAPDAENPASQIYVDTIDGQKELTQISENVQHLTKKYTLVRYYYPEAIRDNIRTEAEPLLKKELS